MSDQVRTATCGCGQLRAEVRGDPVRISVCHCLNCKRRTGAAFSAQARWPDAQVVVSGESNVWTLTGDSGGRGTFRFCPQCGATIAYVIDAMPGLIAIPIGAFADPGFPAPRFSVYEERMHPWTAIVGDAVERW